jgi:hypothetical protein
LPFFQYTGLSAKRPAIYTEGLVEELVSAGLLQDTSRLSAKAVQKQFFIKSKFSRLAWKNFYQSLNRYST